MYGGVNQEISLAAIPSPGGGIYYLGATTSTGNGDADPVLMKLDDNGQVIWARAIGGPNYDVAGAMTLASDGGLVFAGSTKSYNGNTPDDLYFFKTDSLGNLLWAKTFETPDFDVASAVLRTSDNGYAITGFTIVNGLRRVLLIRTDSNGDTLFVRTYGGAGGDQGVELLEMPDGGFVITGKAFTQSLGESDILLLRTDAQGNLSWVKSFGESLWDEGAGIIRLQDGNFLISGSTISFGQGDFDILLLKTDTAGTILWGRTYGSPETDASYTARENLDGSIVLSGYTASMGYGHNFRTARRDQSDSGDRGDDSTNIVLMKVNAIGDTLWTRTFGDGAQDEAFHFSNLSNGGYLIPGFTTSYTTFVDSTQMMLIRTDSLGYSGCHEQDAHPVLGSTAFITQSLTFSQDGGMIENNVTSTALVWNLSAADACLYIPVTEKARNRMRVFPNPARNSLTVETPEELIYSIEIYNLPGETVLHFPAPESVSSAGLDVTRLPAGIYFMEVVTNRSVLTQKIIIQ